MLFLTLLEIAEGLVVALLIAITVDLAYYTARRLYRVIGCNVSARTAVLSILIIAFGWLLFVTAESARQMVAELNVQAQVRPD